jgi:hypothetical protein
MDDCFPFKSNHVLERKENTKSFYLRKIISIDKRVHTLNKLTTALDFDIPYSIYFTVLKSSLLFVHGHKQKYLKIQND